MIEFRAFNYLARYLTAGIINKEQITVALEVLARAVNYDVIRHLCELHRVGVEQTGQKVKAILMIIVIPLPYRPTPQYDASP